MTDLAMTQITPRMILRNTLVGFALGIMVVVSAGLVGSSVTTGASSTATQH